VQKILAADYHTCFPMGIPPLPGRYFTNGKGRVLYHWQDRTKFAQSVTGKGLNGKPYKNAIQRPAATMPNHNRIEQQPASFAPAGVARPSSQLPTRRYTV
jgi:hypothetical protein